MDYEGQVRQTYSISASDFSRGQFLYFFKDGSYEIVTDADFDEAEYTIYTMQGYCANYTNRVLKRGSDLVFFGYVVYNRDIIFCNTNRMDYAIYGNGGGGNTLIGKKFVYGDSLDDLTTIDNYYRSSGYAAFADFQDENNMYGSYYLDNYNGYAVFDYTNIKYGELESSITAIRGENMAFYNYVTEYYYASDNDQITIAYGAPFASQVETAYQSGFSNGYADGYVNGKDDGYIIGVNSQGGTLEQQPATAFTYIQGAFGVASTIMGLEVLPNITLGLCFSIPLVFVLIMTIFKLVRK